MKGVPLAAMLCLSLVAPRFVGATDVWDQPNGQADNSSNTDNELVNGSQQVHDLNAFGGVPDEDWYLVGQQPYSSYEVVVDGLTQEIANIPPTQAADLIQLDLVDSIGTIQNTAYAFSSFGSSRSLRFRNTTGTENLSQYVRVRGGANGCSTSCSANAQYRITFYETTYLIPRFNNSATQITIMILQNGTNGSVEATARFWGPTGTLLASQAISLSAHGTSVINTAGIAGLAGQSGAITIDHTGRYGSLHGKAVALEPATGFTFDTMMTPRVQ